MPENIEICFDDGFNRKIDRRFNQFWVGVIFYTVGIAITSTRSVNISICRIFQVLGLLMFVLAAIQLISFRIKNTYLKIIYFLYCGWLLSIIPRGFELNYGFISQELFFSDTGLFPYLVPLILLFPQNLIYFKKIFNVAVFLSISYIVLSIVFQGILLSGGSDNVIGQNMIESFTKNLGLPIGFLLLTFSYHSGKRRLLAIGIIVLILLLAIIRARRGLIFMSSSTIVFSYILFLFRTRGKLFILFSSMLIIFFAVSYASEFVNQKKGGIFSLLLERGSEDTRTGVEECMYDDMKLKDWIIGRGINGEYFCPGIDEDDLTGYRNVIETGYLQIILNGGMVSLGLLLLIAIPAMSKGLFYSKNVLSKAAGIWILMFLTDLYPTLLAGLTFNCLLFWISIGICFSRQIRNMSDSDIKHILTSK